MEKSVGGALFFCPKAGKSQQITYEKYSIVNKMPQNGTKLFEIG
jgi:hypothetical protein